MCLLMFSQRNRQVWNATLVEWQRSYFRTRKTQSNFALRGNARRDAGVLFFVVGGQVYLFFLAKAKGTTRH